MRTSRLTYARLDYALLVVVGIALTTACASSPGTEPTASQKALLSVAAAQQYAAEVGQSAGRLHAQALLTDSELAEVVTVGTALDTAWRAAALAIAQGDGQALVDGEVAAMEASKLKLKVVWSKYEGRGR